MARLPRLCLPGIPVHIIQRGVNRTACFASDEDLAAYAHWLAKSATNNNVAIHAWVFMTNHVHLLATPGTSHGISKMMQVLGRHYVRYFNYTYQRTGTLWEGRFKSCVIDAEDYLLACQRYIELNPVRAKMVKSPADYRWSSFHSNAGGKPAGLWTPHPVYLRLGLSQEQRAKHYRELFVQPMETVELNTIRTATNQGLALGNTRFKDQIEALTGRRVTSKRPGPAQKATG